MLLNKFRKHCSLRKKREGSHHSALYWSVSRVSFSPVSVHPSKSRDSFLFIQEYINTLVFICMYTCQFSFRFFISYYFRFAEIDFNVHFLIDGIRSEQVSREFFLTVLLSVPHPPSLNLCYRI